MAKNLEDVVQRLKDEGQLTRNSGTHSIKSLKETVVESNMASIDKLIQSNEDIGSASLQDAEKRKEDVARQEEQNEQLKNISDTLSMGLKSSSDNNEKKGSSLFDKISGAVGTLGIGLGAAALGVGAAGAGVAYLIDTLQGVDTAKIKAQVTDLLSIGDEFEGGSFGFLLEGGAFGLAMAGIGAGLAVFAVGSAAAGAAQEFTSLDTNKIKEQVSELLSIGDMFTGGSFGFLLKGGAFGLAMAGIGAGLAVFGAGAAVAGLSDALISFTGSDDFATTIKERVKTLLSIGDELGGAKAFIGDSATFLVAMTGIAGGLAVFGAGSAVAGLADGLTKFTSGEDFATTIKERVKTLLSISSLEGLGADTAVFVASMTGIAAGLAVFGAGSTVAGVGQGLGDALAKFNGESDFANNIKGQVKTLVSMTDLLDGDGSDSKAGKFALGMAKIGAGLAAFAAGSFVSTLASAGQAVLSFFVGESPFDQLMKIADNQDDLTKGANALEKITKSLDAFGSLDVDFDEIDFEGLAKNLGKALPLLNGLANGGKVSGGLFSFDVDFGKGLLDPSLKIDEMAEMINKVRYVLSGGKAGDISLKPSRADSVRERAASIVNEESATLESRRSAANNSPIVNAVTNGGSTANVDTSSKNVNINNSGFADDTLGGMAMSQQLSAGAW